MHMPDELQTREELMVFIKTPQFRQTIDSLATVLSSEQMYTILMSMGIDTSAAPFPGVEGFLQVTFRQHKHLHTVLVAPNNAFLTRP